MTAMYCIVLQFCSNFICICRLRYKGQLLLLVLFICTLLSFFIFLYVHVLRFGSRLLNHDWIGLLSSYIVMHCNEMSCERNKDRYLTKRFGPIHQVCVAHIQKRKHVRKICEYTYIHTNAKIKVTLSQNCCRGTVQNYCQ